MGKLFTWVVLSLFVLVVPLGSWYYLKTGQNYRKSAIKELMRKDSFSIIDDTLDVFRGRTTVFIPAKQKVDKITLDKLQEQFGKTENFQILLGDSLTGMYAQGIFAKYSDKQFLLIDTGRYIRNMYAGGINDIKKLVEHTAIVLPRLKEIDIKMQRDSGKK